MLVIQLWVALNSGGRQQLSSIINDLMGTLPAEAGGNPPPDESLETRQASVTPKPARVRVWDRDIIKDVPAVQAFKQKSAKERGQDTETSKRLSIATGAVARGRKLKVPKEDILSDLIASWSEPQLLHDLYMGETGSSAIDQRNSSDDDNMDIHEADDSGVPVSDNPGRPVDPPDLRRLMDKSAREEGAVRQAMELSLSTAQGSTAPRNAQQTSDGNARVGKPTGDVITDPDSRMVAKRWGDEETSDDEMEGEVQDTSAAAAAGSEDPSPPRSGTPSEKRKRKKRKKANR
jgi:hypothetical protein